MSSSKDGCQDAGSIAPVHAVCMSFLLDTLCRNNRSGMPVRVSYLEKVITILVEVDELLPGREYLCRVDAVGHE